MNQFTGTQNPRTVVMFFITLVGLVITVNHSLAVPASNNNDVASMRLLTAGDIKGMSRWDLKIMRNAIFARHGYKFKSEEMRAHFNQQTWYRPQYDDVSDKLSEIERANIKLLKQAENQAPVKSTLSNMAERIAAQKRKVLFHASWGTGPADLGRAGGQEAAMEGPMSFAVSENGELLILDQVNQRVQVFNVAGQHTKTISIPGRTFSDIDIAPSGNLVLLDIYRHKSVLIIDQRGNVLEKIKLNNAGITDLSALIGLYARGDGIWVDNGENLVRISDISGKIDQDTRRIDGILSQDGKHSLKANILGDITAMIKQRPFDKSNGQAFTVYFDIPVLYLTLIDKTEDGSVFIGASLLEALDTMPPYSLDQAHEVVVVFDQNGKEKHRVYMSPSFYADGGTRWIRVGPSGTIYQLVQHEDKTTMWRYDP